MMVKEFYFVATEKSITKLARCNDHADKVLFFILVKLNEKDGAES